MITTFFEKRGFEIRHNGGGFKAWERRFPSDHFVWITNSENGIEFFSENDIANICAYDRDAQPIGTVISVPLKDAAAPLRIVCRSALEIGLTAFDLTTQVENSIHAAFRHLQMELGVIDGGVAAAFASGPNEEKLQEIMTNYVALELSYLRDEFADDGALQERKPRWFIVVETVAQGLTASGDDVYVDEAEARRELVALNSARDEAGMDDGGYSIVKGYLLNGMAFDSLETPIHIEGKIDDGANE